MRVALLVVALFGLALASDLSFYKFTKFVNEYGKDYHTKEEFDYRFNAFKDNLKKIDRLNAANIAAGGEAVFGINIFADMPAHEFAQRLMKNLTLEVVEPFTSVAPDADIDWRNSGAVTAVKDQGQCGSCWAHSATEAVESYSFLLKEVSTLQTLSVQQTTACTYNYNGCNGGWPYDAYNNAVIARGGEDSAADYPYSIPQAGTCKFGTGKADKPVANIKGYKNIAPRFPRHRLSLWSSLCLCCCRSLANLHWWYLEVLRWFRRPLCPSRWYWRLFHHRTILDCPQQLGHQLGN